MKIRPINILIIVLLIASRALAQDFIRLSEMINKDNVFHTGKFGKYLAVLSEPRIYNPWFSFTDIYIDGNKIKSFPLGLKSPDLLPLLTSISEFRINEKYFDNSDILMQRQITDSSGFAIRTFIGSETGDPLIHIYSRPELFLPNKNKIIPSVDAVCSYVDSIYKIRVSGAYYGFFNTGYENDALISRLNSYYSGKQNKQFIISVENTFTVGTWKLKANAALNTFYGWDRPPVLNHPLHFESYLSDFNLSAETERLSVAFLRDQSITQIHKATGIEESRFYLQDNSAEINILLFRNNGLNIALNNSLWYSSAENISGKKYFAGTEVDFGMKSSVEIEKCFSNNFSLLVEPAFGLSDQGNIISTKAALKYSFNQEENIQVSAAYSGEPFTDAEKEASYSVWYPENTAFTISAIPYKDQIMIKKIAGSFDYNYFKNDFRFKIGVFKEFSFETANRQMAATDSQQVFEWHKAKGIHNAGISGDIQFQPTEEMNIYAGMQFGLSNSTSNFITKSGILQTDILLPFKAKASFVCRVNPEIRLRGYIQKSSAVLNIEYIQNMEPVIGMPAIDFVIYLENLSDCKTEFMPGGNSLGRVFIFMLKGSF